MSGWFFWSKKFLFRWGKTFDWEVPGYYKYLSRIQISCVGYSVCNVKQTPKLLIKLITWNNVERRGCCNRRFETLLYVTQKSNERMGLITATHHCLPILVDHVLCLVCYAMYVRLNSAQTRNVLCLPKYKANISSRIVITASRKDYKAWSNTDKYHNTVVHKENVLCKLFSLIWKAYHSNCAR